ncbi:hypothetical protein PENTCL1PPCAC_13898, partial [Pristionchus entomophagus]
LSSRLIFYFSGTSILLFEFSNSSLIIMMRSKRTSDHLLVTFIYTSNLAGPFLLHEDENESN